MNIVISCVVNGNTEYIEMYGNEALTLDVSFAEIQDITKKNSAYSRDFKVPGSKMNNYIFNYFFEINQVPLDFTPSKKFEASILYNGYIISSGYIRLNSVMIDKLEKSYSITYYNGIGDVAASIGDKFMAQLDLTSLSHPFTDDVYLQSQVDPNLFPLSGLTNYSYQNGKTFWGLYNIGYNYVSSLSGISSYYVGTSTTNVSISSGNKTITTNPKLPFIPGDIIRYTDSANHYIQGTVQTVNGTSITFTANLGLGTGNINSGTISRILGENISINDPNTTPLLEFQSPNVPNYMSFSGTPIRNYYFKPSIQVKELYTQIFNQAGYQIESSFFDTNYFEKYYLPLKFLDETVYTQGSQTPCFTLSGGASNLVLADLPNTHLYANNLTGFTCNNIPFSATAFTFTIPNGYAGNYTFRSSVSYTASWDFYNDAGIFGGITVNGNDYNIFSQSFYQNDPAQPVQSSFFTTTQDQTVNITTPGVISIWIDYLGSVSISSFTFEIVSAPRFIVGNFNYANEFPPNDFKQIDFITSINKYFNLVCIPSTLNPKSIIVEPIVNYIGKGQILDWSDKIDFDSSITVSPTTTLVNGTLNYNFKLDQDFQNQQFNISSNRIFGTYQLQLNQEYKDNVINFDTIFASPTDLSLNNNNLPAITIPSMAAVKTQENKGSSVQQFNPYKILPRIIFRGCVLPNENWSVVSTGDTTQYWWAESYKQDRWQELNRFTTYPFSYTGFSHYINYNSSDSYNSLESTFPNQQDMYDIYYYDYISDITAPENKIYQAKIYLTPYEIANLEFNEKILIKNAYFRINKISGYNLTEANMCNIELVKLTKDYTPTPIQYYDLINCNSGGTDYHTNSDLNYNMYAYVGNYVNIFTGATTGYTSIGCFKVELGQQNYSYDYNHVFIGSGYTSSGVAVYSDCGCSGRTPFNIVQQT
jgi:hypothetical protein